MQVNYIIRAMRKLPIKLILLIILFSCKKETPTPISIANDVVITGFDCANTKVFGSFKKQKSVSNIKLSIAYTGGNGKTYLSKSHNSTGVFGLTAKLDAGTLANGEGLLTYTISGTPSSAGNASFTISLGGQNCIINVQVEDYKDQISNFNCGGVKISGKLKKHQFVNNVIATITYSGGNGEEYLQRYHNSTGVLGLSANLNAGSLANGEGLVNYTISGVPDTAGIASFSISLGGQNCIINVKVEDYNENKGFPGPNITDIDGNSYKTVIIGTQQWMADNLKVSKFNNGTNLTHLTDPKLWGDLIKELAWTNYNHNSALDEKYGKLYNWFALSPTMNGNRNICPIGWHVPSLSEWSILTEYLGGDSIAGGKMKEKGTNSWKSPNVDASNMSLFNGLPGGALNSGDIGSKGYWWSATEGTGPTGTSSAGFIYLLANSGIVYKDMRNKWSAFSVRCVKD